MQYYPGGSVRPPADIPLRSRCFLVSPVLPPTTSQITASYWTMFTHSTQQRFRMLLPQLKQMKRVDLSVSEAEDELAPLLGSHSSGTWWYLFTMGTYTWITGTMLTSTCELENNIIQELVLTAGRTNQSYEMNDEGIKKKLMRGRHKIVVHNVRDAQWYETWWWGGRQVSNSPLLWYSLLWM